MSALPLSGLLMLSCAVGYIAGRVVSVGSAAKTDDVAIVDDSRSGTAVVTIDRIVNGEITGSIHGDARFFLGSTLIASGSGSFHAPAALLLKNVITVQVPSGMRYVASKRGKNYYPVDSSMGKGIVPENRIYFESMKEAEAAGYKK